ncbi:MAG TPA: hypothetical protein VNA25_30350 [Phycisphaerae bacterium]|nr:hypothetical protein [Phycisphaerae bacterium]
MIHRHNLLGFLILLAVVAWAMWVSWQAAQPRVIYLDQRRVELVGFDGQQLDLLRPMLERPRFERTQKPEKLPRIR